LKAPDETAKLYCLSRQSVKGHHLPIFQGLRFSMSGFELGAQQTAETAAGRLRVLTPTLALPLA
jgi:hypothetical protein